MKLMANYNELFHRMLRCDAFSCLARPAMLLLTAILVAGCNIKDRIVWSPDGQYLAVIAADGLRIGNDQGGLSKPLVADAELMAWCPDSRRALVVRQAQGQDWKAIQGFLSEDDLKQVISTAEVMVRELLSCQGDFDECEQKVSSDKGYVRRFSPEAFWYLKAKYNRQLSEKLGSDWDGLSPDPINLSTLQLYELSPRAAVAGKVIYRTTKDIGVVRVSSRGRAAALVEAATGETNPLRLYVLSLSGGEPRLVTDSALQYPDWSVDGLSLLFMQDGNGSFESLNLATLRSLTVCTPAGELKSEFGQGSDLMKVVHRSNEERVRSLADGTILFSALPLQLPGKDLSGENTLYQLSPDKDVPVRIVPAGYPTDVKAQYFEVSPDGKKVAMPGSHGEVVVADLLSHGLSVVQAWQEEIDSVKFVPQWRNSDELCFAVGAVRKTAVDHGCDVALKSMAGGVSKILSKDWPTQAIKGLLTSDKVPETKLQKLMHNLK